MDSFSEIFKAYDVRGLYPSQVNPAAARRVGQAFVAVRQPRKVAVGQDVRASGKKLKAELTLGLLGAGVDVIDIGVITTDQLYFAVGKYGLDGGISVTASHNPAEYNGFKFAESGGAPISSEDLLALRDWAASDKTLAPAKAGSLSELEILDDYVKSVLNYVRPESIKPFRLLANANFGAVGRAVDIIAAELRLELERLNWQEDGTFPKGTPNPLLPENRAEVEEQLKKLKPDLGVAWDADADRCFFFTDSGIFIPSCYIIALLAKEFIKKEPGAKIIYDLTTAWVIDDAVKRAGGQPIANRTGHTFIKQRMRQEKAIFGGESSGHYYFRDSFCADNGLVPLLMILELMSQTGKSLEELVQPLMDAYKVSGEINFKIAEPAKLIAVIEKQLGQGARLDKTDGIVIGSDKWRLSVRTSNTEPLVRLNAESRTQADLDGLMARVQKLIEQNT